MHEFSAKSVNMRYSYRHSSKAQKTMSLRWQQTLVVSTLEENESMTTLTRMVCYHLGLYRKEGLWDHYATSTILSSSLTKSSMHKVRIISATAIGLLTNLAPSLVWWLGYCLACRQVSVHPERRRNVKSHSAGVPEQQNPELVSPEVNSVGIIFRVNRCSHNMRECSEWLAGP